MSWRPSKWKNPYKDYSEPLLKFKGDGYELGADAMLEALRKNRIPIDKSSFLPLWIDAEMIYGTKKGKFVFIPDDKETNDR